MAQKSLRKQSHSGSGLPRTTSLGAHRFGFTIVELLVVIVVIGILAAITIIAYNGVQERTKSTAVISLAKSYRDGLQLWAADVGSYPVPTGTASCIGPAASFSGTVCPDAPGWYSPATYDLAFNQKLNSYVGQADGQLGYWGGSPVGVIWYHSNYYGLGHAVLTYYIGPQSDCGLQNIENSDRTVTGANYTTRGSDHTTCIIQLN